MVRYRKWALMLGLMAVTPGVAEAAGRLSLFKSKTEQAAAAPAAGETAKRGNQAIANDIANSLRAANLSGYEIEIEFKNGTAILSGMITDESQKAKATEMAKRVPEVKQVDNQLTPIEDSAAPSRRARGPIQQVAATSPATLDPATQASAAAITNNQAAAQQVAASLQKAKLSGFDIQVKYQDGVAQLSGAVSTPQEKAKAYEAAASTPGVRQVQNLLTVAGQQGGYPQGPQGPGMMPPQYAQAPYAAGPYGQVAPAGYQPGDVGLPPGAMPLGAGMPSPGSGAVLDSPNLPEYAWPSYASYPNYAAVTYPKQYAASAWPYIGPFYPYPQVPLGWRDVRLEWDDGYWQLDFSSRTDRWWWFVNPKNWGDH